MGMPPVANNSPLTRPSLLARLRDPDNQRAWEEFVEIYTPLVFGFSRRAGLQEADAADVAQEVMRAVARSMERFEYDPRQGKFRNWLLTVVRSKLHNLLASRQRQPVPWGQSTLHALVEETPAPQEQSDWDVEYHRHLFRWAAERIRADFQETTWQAFWRMTVEQQDGQRVARDLGMSLGAVYVAKSRVLARLRHEIQAVTEEDVPAVPG